MDYIEVLQAVKSGNVPSFFEYLDSKLEKDERETIKSIVTEIPKLIKTKESLRIVILIINYLEILENYKKWLEHPIYLNEFNDKYGNKYLQARTSIKGKDGKTKWVNAYVGSLNDYPKGANDPLALAKAKPLIRKKLKKYFELK